MDLSQEEQELVKDLFRDNLITEALEFVDSLDVDDDWEQLKKEIVSSKKKEPIQITWRPLMKYAAVFIGLIGTAYFFYNAYLSNTTVAEIPEDAITLTLDDGTIKVINSDREQEAVLQNGKMVALQKGSKIHYNTGDIVEELVYNQLEVPYGKTFGITLSDGTIVYLNSGTKLKFPIKFIKGQNREVFIDGEAFFEVTRDAEHPFIVNTQSTTVEVLGTKFNVSSFSEDDNINTVLVEGKVNIYNTENPNQSFILKPGQKGSWNRFDQRLSLEDVDTRLYTSWINGEMIFRNSSFDNMAKKLERRYDISIQSNNKILNSKKFNASFHVDIESIEDVMDALNNIHPFTYRILHDQDQVIID